MIITLEVQNKLNPIKIIIIVSGSDNDIEIFCVGVYKVSNGLLTDFSRDNVSAHFCVVCSQLAVSVCD